MKTIKFLIIVITVTILFTDCSSKHVVNSNQNSSSQGILGLNIDIPCTVRDDDNYFRDRGIISATNIQNARAAALYNAKKMIINKLNGVTKEISTSYFQDIAGNSTTNEVKQEMEGALTIAVTHALNDAKTICEEIFQTDDGNYTAVIAIEISKQALIEQMAKEMAIKPTIDLNQFRKNAETSISNK